MLKAFFSLGCLILSVTIEAWVNIPNPSKDQRLVRSWYGKGNYLHFANQMDASQIKVILEIGSRDAIDAIELGYHYQCPVYAFECNPEGIELCGRNATDYPYVTIVPYACWNETKCISFYPVVFSHGGKAPVNIGGSSCLRVRPDGVDSHHIQGDPIHVQAVRLDEWLQKNKIDQVDLLCMDVQGATIQVLEGMGKELNKVKYLITEVYLQPAFKGEALYPQIKEFLRGKGFDVIKEPQPNTPFEDVLFINKNFK